MTDKPTVRYMELRYRPSEYYLRTGNMVQIIQYMTREEIERIWPSCSQTEQELNAQKPHEQSNPQRG